MAIEILALAWDVALPPARKLVLLALADHADAKTRKCWPSVQRVAERTGLTERSVQQQLAGLREAGFIKIDASALRGRGRARVYVVLPTDTELSTGAMWKTSKGERGSGVETLKGERGSSVSPEWVNVGAQRGERGAPQSVEPSDRSNLHARAREAEPATPSPGAPQLDLANGWTVHAPAPRWSAGERAGHPPSPASQHVEGLAGATRALEASTGTHATANARPTITAGEQQHRLKE